ncbi:MAG: hypothetical protein NXY57DRAFT_1020051 [Lentinula lateritia]|nr:MAG: hypothetical protein NXY57DRAFT_1020051 [Lentinula lateritia]
MFKRIARKRKREEEDEALGLDEEVKEALGLGGVDWDEDSDSDESDGEEEEESDGEEEEEEDGEEDGENEEEEEEETEDVDMDMKDDSDSEEKRPTISKRALKKQARQRKIRKIRDRHAIWKKEKIQVASKVSSTLETTPSTIPRRHQGTLTTTTTTTSSKSSPTIKDPVAASRVDAVDSAQNNNTGGLERENGARPKSQSKFKSKPDAAVTHVKDNAAPKSPLLLSSPDETVAGDVRAEGKKQKKRAATWMSELNDAILKKKKKKKRSDGKRDIVLSNGGDIDGYVDEGEVAKVRPRKSSPTRTNTTTTTTTNTAVASALPPKTKKPKHQNTAKDIDTKLLKKGIRKKHE